MDSTPRLRRRTVLAGAGASALAAAYTTLDLVGPLGRAPARAAVIPAAVPADIQFDIAAVSAAPQTSDTGVQFAMPPVHTLFLTGWLLRTPTRADQTELNRVLNTLESKYLWSAAQLITFVSYGLPIEQNDLLFMLRSDNFSILQDVINWFNGSNRLAGHPNVASPAFAGLLSFTSSRHMFVQIGLTQAVAQQNALPFANFIQHQSPMWMGFADQQTNAAGPAAICTFAGNPSARLTTAVAGDYFDNGAVQHLAHDILDMLQFYDMASPTSPPGDDGVFTERVQYMFHSPAIDPGRADQFTDGGGPAFLQNQNRGPGYAAQTAQGIGTEGNEHRMGHLSTLQRTSRAADGTPIHMRMDGPGFDNLDVPGGSSQPKLEFTVFVPSAEFFRTMRVSQASLDLAQQFAVPAEDNGLERFLTATRRQNFLIPPRRHRAFPLVELT
jgi:hypothetical protein